MSHLELAQEAQIISREEAYLCNIMLQDSNTLHAHTKGKTSVFSWIIANIAQHTRVNHTRAKNLYPATIFTDTATFAIAERAIDIDLSARLGEREVATAETHAPSLSEHFTGETLETTLQASHRAFFIDEQTFNLV